jgi:hypothetical protein
MGALLWIGISLAVVIGLMVFACGRSPRYDDIGAIEHDGRTKSILCDKCGKECLPFSGHNCTGYQ